MNLETYLIQHKSVADEMNIIKELAKKSDIDAAIPEIATHINTLAGKINMHLSMEDKYLYPHLAESEDSKIKNMAVKYQEEMGGLAKQFNEFKEKYNTKPHFLEHKATFKTDMTKVFGAIEARVKREESELYKHI